MKQNETKKVVLIIRSVSFQQLDKNLEAVSRRFPGHEFHLLTHPHGRERAGSYALIDRIFDYDSRRNFSFFHVPCLIRRKKENSVLPYEAVVVPVTNKTGVGFLNVMMMALRIPSRGVYVCNMTSEIWTVSHRQIVLRSLRSSAFSLLAGVFTVPVGIISGLVLLPFELVSRLRGREGIRR
jgi:hypothetical protein